MKTKFTLTDPWMGSREVDPNDELAMIRDQHKLLCKWRDERAKPTQTLLDDIQVYEYILKHPEASKVARLYMNKMDEQRRKHGWGFPKMKVAKMLGWFQ